MLSKTEHCYGCSSDQRSGGAIQLLNKKKKQSKINILCQIVDFVGK